MKKITVREDFRRDGLSANFRADATALFYAANSIPGSRINIGYPVICKEEEKRCEEIAAYAKKSQTEFCLVGHTREDNLAPILSILNKYPQNTSANLWIPISDYFINQTVKVSTDTVRIGLENIVQKWKSESEAPLDIAFVDCTAEEKYLPQRINEWARKIKSYGVRDIIICDSLGLGTPDKIEEICSYFPDMIQNIEFHLHNDNNLALKNIDVALKYGVTKFGTAYYKSGERCNMLDPRELISRGLDFDSEQFEKFNQRYRELIGDPEIIIPKVYQSPTVVTGTQYRLRGRAKNLVPKFGVTSDSYIAKLLLEREVSNKELAELKDKLFYNSKNNSIILTKEELKNV